MRRIQRQLLWNLRTNVENDLLLQNWRGTFLLNLLIRYLESGDLRMNLRVPPTGWCYNGPWLLWSISSQCVLQNSIAPNSSNLLADCRRIYFGSATSQNSWTVCAPSRCRFHVQYASWQYSLSSKFELGSNIYIYIFLMRKTIGTDLRASTDRIKNSLENGQVVEHQHKSQVHSESTVLRPYQIPAKITVGTCSWGIYELFGRNISKEAVVTPQLVQTWLELSRTFQCQPDLHNMFVDVSVIKKRGQDYRGQIAAGDSTSWQTYSSDPSQVCICRQLFTICCRLYILKEGLVQPNATELPDSIYTPDFYSRAAICQTHDERYFQHALNEALAYI